MGDEPKGQDLESFSFNLGRRRYHFYDVVFVLVFRCFFFPRRCLFSMELWSFFLLQVANVNCLFMKYMYVFNIVFLIVVLLLHNCSTLIICCSIFFDKYWMQGLMPIDTQCIGNLAGSVSGNQKRAFLQYLLPLVVVTNLEIQKVTNLEIQKKVLQCSSIC